MIGAHRSLCMGEINRKKTNIEAKKRRENICFGVYMEEELILMFDREKKYIKHIQEE